jgi:cytoskeletal protein RodZ
MADQFKLKAFVRIDGSGKVIPGGPILQAEKPTVGNWREINAKECCNYVPTSTTTTSSTSSTSSTSTTTSSTSSTTTSTTTAYVGTYYVAGPTAEVCGGTGPYSLPLIVDPNACSNGNITLAVGTYADYGISNGSTIYINLQNGNAIQVQVFGSVQMSMGCTSCG